MGLPSGPLRPSGKMGLGRIRPAPSPVPLLPPRTLCVLLAGLQLAVSFALAAAVLYASWHDPELCARLLSLVPPEESCTSLAYDMGKVLLMASEGLWPP